MEITPTILPRLQIFLATNLWKEGSLRKTAYSQWFFYKINIKNIIDKTKQNLSNILKKLKFMVGPKPVLTKRKWKHFDYVITQNHGLIWILIPRKYFPSCYEFSRSIPVSCIINLNRFIQVPVPGVPFQAIRLLARNDLSYIKENPDLYDLFLSSERWIGSRYPPSKGKYILQPVFIWWDNITCLII